MSYKEFWEIPISHTIENITNPIRRFVESNIIEYNSQLPVINVNIGDPTVFGLKPPIEAFQAIQKAAEKDRSAYGYGPANGLEAAKLAVTQVYGSTDMPLSTKDVTMTSGASGALDIILSTLVDVGDNILIPCPGFSLYKTISQAHDFEGRSYRLLPEKSWEVDLDHLESLIDSKTRCIVVNNPSNPCGSNYSREHLLEIIAVALKHKLPIVSDEIYDKMVFPGQTFYPLASLTRTVPIFTVGAISKNFMAPGWRLGWLLFYNSRLEHESVVRGIFNASSILLGPNVLLQRSLSDILLNTPEEFFTTNSSNCMEISGFIYKRLSKCDLLKPIKPEATLFMMVGIDTERTGFTNDREFVLELVKTTSVFCLPGQMFGMTNYVRIITCMDKQTAEDLCDRMIAFCESRRGPE